MLTPEQLELRKSTLGSSEVGAAIGLNRWMTPHQLWCVKKGLLETEASTATRVGHKLEPVIAEMYQEDTGAELAHFGTVVHPTIPWMSATPDRAVYGQTRLVEIKCVGYRSAFDWGGGPEDVPDYYRAQVEWQMAVCGVEETDVAALIGGTDFRIYRIRRNAELFGAIFAAAERFWHRHVLGNEPPPVDGSDGAREMLGKLFPRSRPGVLKPATPDAEQIARELATAKRQAAQVEETVSRLENKLREAIGDAEGIVGDGFKATWKSDKSGKRSLRVTTKGSKEAA